MKEIFNEMSDWLWPFIGKIFTTIWDFLGDILHSFFENQNSIMSIIGFIFLSLLALFALDKLIRFILGYFSKYNKSDVKNLTKKALIFIFIMLIITSFVSYQTRSCG
jgi:hypothetical protein